MAIIVGYIPTAEGKAALDRAAEESLLRKTDLVVIDSGRDREGEGAGAIAEVTTKLGEQGITVSTRALVRGNEPAEDLIAVAEEIDAELIVIGLRRRTPVGKLILGSNAQRTLLDAPCPVLAVKA